MKPMTDQIAINIPREFVDKEIEIIIRPVKTENGRNKKERLLEIFEKYNVVLPENYKFNREELHER
jgi:hypothetical protein